MLENLKNQERLSQDEEDRIDNRIRIIVLVMTGVVVAVIIWALVTKKPIGTWYYALILTLLAVIWLIKCVAATFLKHALAQRTDEQVSAYLKAAGLEFVSYAGLAWFLIGMNGNGIFGAIAYLVAMTAARKQRELYYQEPETEEHPDGETQETSASFMEHPEKGETGKKKDADEVSALGALPSAADREQREKEHEDGSV